MRAIRLLCVLLVAGLIVSGSVAYTQETTGTITGRIVDAQGLAVPGATITVTSTQGVKTFTSESNGTFNAPFLTPGSYAVKVELEGFATVERTNVVVRLGQTVTLNLTLQIGGVAETVQVSGATPIVDTQSTTTGASLDSRLLERVPIGRRFSDTLYMAAGVSRGGSVGAANPSVSGASGLENQYVVDGVNITNAGYGALGSYSIVFGSLGNGTPYDFMQEVQVKTGGYEAEYGQATGGVVNVITKSGSNTLGGTLFGYSRPKRLESAYAQIQTPNGSVNTLGTQTSDAGIALGGPVLKNRLFYFAAIDPQWEGRTLVAPQSDDRDQFPLAALGPVDRNRRVVSYATKASWQFAGGHRIDASLFGDPAMGANGPQRPDALIRETTAAFSKLQKYGGHNQTIKYDGVVNAHWLVEASVGRARNTMQEVPSVNEWQVSDRTIIPNVLSGGIGVYEADNIGTNWQYQVKSTHLFGGHQVRYGLLFEDVEYIAANQRTGPTFITQVGDRTATGASIQILPDPVYGKVYRVVRANLNARRDTSQKYTSFFAQDTWKLGDRITLRPGVRYEQETLVGTIVKDFALKNNWAPRLGVTWDPAGDGKSKVYGSFGWFFQRVPNDLAARALSADAGIAGDYFDAQLTRPIPNGVPALGRTVHYSISGASADTIDPNVKLGYMQEFITGVERELFKDVNVGVRYVHRTIPRVLEDVTPFPIVAADLGIAGADSVDYTLTNPGPNTPTAGGLGASFEKPIHNYDSVEFTIDKRFSNNWGVQASYRWSRLWGNYEGSYRDDNGQSDPGITSLYDFPTNDPSYAAIGVPDFGYLGDVRYLGALGNGPLPLDRPHQVKVFGNYAFRNNLTVGLGLNLTSGKPLTALASNPQQSYQNAGEIPMTPRGKGFETADGFRTRTPFQSEVSAHVDYSLRLDQRRRVVLLADVFNVLNRRTVLDYDNYYEITTGAMNPNFGQPTTAAAGSGNWPQIQSPRQFRFGARFEF